MTTFRYRILFSVLFYFLVLRDHDFQHFDGEYHLKVFTFDADSFQFLFSHSGDQHCVLEAILYELARILFLEYYTSDAHETLQNGL